MGLTKFCFRGFLVSYIIIFSDIVLLSVQTMLEFMLEFMESSSRVAALNLSLDIYQRTEKEGEKKNALFSLSTWRTALDSRHHHEDSNDILKDDLVVIARFLSKSKDGKEHKRAPNHDPPIQFEIQLA